MGVFDGVLDGFGAAEIDSHSLGGASKDAEELRARLQINFDGSLKLVRSWHRVSVLPVFQCTASQHSWRRLFGDLESMQVVSKAGHHKCTILKVFINL